MRYIQYTFRGDGILRFAVVPEGWPDDAVAEVLAFRAGASPGDKFKLEQGRNGIYNIVATGSAT
jgi:hypothetical protein